MFQFFIELKREFPVDHFITLLVSYITFQYSMNKLLVLLHTHCLAVVVRFSAHPSASLTKKASASKAAPASALSVAAQSRARRTN